MKQQVKVNNTVYQVDYEKTAGKIKVSVDDQSYLLDAAVISGGFYSFLLDGHSHDLHVEGEDDHFSVLVAGESYEVDFYDPRTRRPTDVKRSASESQQTICAPMAGRIVRFQVEPGDMVADGDGLIVLEAMKMETSITAERDATVKRVLAKIGDQFDAKDLLVEFE